MKIMQRFLMFCAGVVLALGSSLATMEGGAALTLAQVGQIPLLAWILALGAGITSALDGQVIKNTGNAARVAGVSIVLLAMGGMMSGCSGMAPKNASQQLYVAKQTLATVNNLITISVNAKWITPTQAQDYAGKVDKLESDIKTVQALLGTIGEVEAKTKTQAILDALIVLESELAAKERSNSP